MLLATMFCYFFFYTGSQTFGFAIPGIQKELGLTKQQLGWISATMLWGYAFGQAINGNLGDKYGGRRAMTAGAVLSCLTNWAVSFSTGFFSICTLWGLNGYFQALGWAPGSRLLSNWWGSDERGKLYGLYLFSSGAAAILSFTTSILVVEIFQLDWRWIFRLPVCLMLLGGITFYLVVRDRPEELGFKSPSDDEESKLKEFREIPDDESSIERYKAVLSNWRLSVAGLTIGFANAARWGLIVWIPVHFLGRTSTTVTTSGQKWIMVALPTGMAIGAVTNGWVSDKFFGSRRSGAIMLYEMLAIFAALGMFFIPTDHVALLAITLFLCGFFVFGPYASLFALCPDLVGVKRAGTATGILSFYAYFLAGVSGPLIGGILDRYPNTNNIFLVVAIACALSATTAFFIRR